MGIEYTADMMAADIINSLRAFWDDYFISFKLNEPASYVVKSHDGSVYTIKVQRNVESPVTEFVSFEDTARALRTGLNQLIQIYEEHPSLRMEDLDPLAKHLEDEIRRHTHT